MTQGTRKLGGQGDLGGAPFAFYTPADGQFTYQYQNQVGTDEVRVKNATVSTFTALVHGEAQPAGGAGFDEDPYHFAELNDLPGSSTMHAGFREYDPTTGRWTSPDPYDGSYDLTDPQSLNRYTYAANNPLTFSDPSGLYTYVDGNGCTHEVLRFYVGGVYDSSTDTVLGCSGGFSGRPGGPPSPVGGPGGVGGSAGNPPISCNTITPGGRTVGSVVREQRALMANTYSSLLNSKIGMRYGTFLSIVQPNGPIDFKKGQSGETFVQMGFAGNFAYYAIGAGFFSPSTLDAGAGAYALTAAAFFPKSTVHFSDLTGNLFSDSAAAQMRGPGLAAKGCSIP